MRVPVVQGVVERRLLINYRLDPEWVSTMIPAPFQPQLVNGYAVAGICLIRPGHLRPRSLPARLGLTSENAAHRFAVQWCDETGERTGVYIPQRHSASVVNVALGDRLFPGAHRRARFDVTESASCIAVAFEDPDGTCSVEAAATVSDHLRGSELFASTDEASAFFRNGSAGFSPARHAARFSGMELRTDAWTIEPAVIDHVRSSWFDDRTIFPAGTIQLDSALVMRNVPVQWHSIGSMPTPASNNTATRSSARRFPGTGSAVRA